MDLDLGKIRQLIKMLAGTDVAEIEIREEAQTIRVTRQLTGQGGHVSSPQSTMTYYAPPHPVSLPPVVPGKEVASALGNRGEEETTDRTITIESPMVGTYYQANTPEAPPLVSRGDVIKKGQVVCIIEAMKLMNEIESESAGRIISILKENASPVEYGEPLFLLEPV